MAKYKNKTVETTNSVAGYVAKITGGQRRKDVSALIDLIAEHTGFEAKMWGPGIVGFGSYHYKYESGHEGDAPAMGFASRANAIALYINNFEGREELLAKFGKHKTAKGCVYIQKLEDIDEKILMKMVKQSIAYIRKKYP
jgi:hypothetical protein